MFKDGFDGVFILELLLGLYDVLYDGSDTIYNVLFFGYVVWLNYGIKYETMLVLLLWSEYGIKYGFLIRPFFGSDVGIEYGFDYGLLLRLFHVF